MKTTGIVRKVDELGRVVIPAELRRIFSIEEKDALEVYVDGDMIILQKYQPNLEKEYVKENLDLLIDKARSEEEVEVLKRAIKLIGQ